MNKKSNINVQQIEPEYQYQSMIILKFIQIKMDKKINYFT